MWKGPFLYRDRPVRWGTKGTKYGTLFAFEDPMLKGEEEHVEQAFDAMKNELESDKTYLRSIMKIPRSLSVFAVRLRLPRYSSDKT